MVTNIWGHILAPMNHMFPLSQVMPTWCEDILLNVPILAEAKRSDKLHDGKEQKRSGLHC